MLTERRKCASNYSTQMADAFGPINKNMTELMSFYNGENRSKTASNDLLNAINTLRSFAKTIELDTTLVDAIYEHCKLPLLPTNFDDGMNMMLDPTMSTNTSKNVNLINYMVMLCRVDKIERIII